MIMEKMSTCLLDGARAEETRRAVLGAGDRAVRRAVLGAGDSPTKATVQQRTTRLVSAVDAALPVPPPRADIPRAGASTTQAALGVAAVASKARRRRAAAEAKAACWRVRLFRPGLLFLPAGFQGLQGYGFSIVKLKPLTKPTKLAVFVT
jgi:hypothetical protein